MIAGADLDSFDPNSFLIELGFHIPAPEAGGLDCTTAPNPE